MDTPVVQPPSPQPIQPLPQSSPQPAKPKKFISILLLFSACLGIILFAPIPYYQSEEVLCEMAQTCPNPVWHTNPPLIRSILSYINRSHELESTIVLDESSSPTPDPIANWKMFTMKGCSTRQADFEYSIKTPDGWVVSKTSDSQYRTVYKITEGENKSIEINCDTAGIGDIACVNGGELFQYGCFWTSDPTTKGFGSKYNKENPYGSFVVTSYGVEKSLLTQILSTFKFMDQVDDTTDWKTYSSPKIDVPQHSFVLRYPSSWSLKADQSTQEPQGLTVTLTKQQDTIKISQGVGGGGRCVYFDDPDYSSYQDAGSFFKSYIQLLQSVNWRLSEYRDNFQDFTHIVCEQDSSIYLDGTRIGWITINLKNQSNLEEIKKILSKISFDSTEKSNTIFNQ